MTHHFSHDDLQLTKTPQRLREIMAQVNDRDKPKRMMLVNVPVSPSRITGRRPIRSESMPHRMPNNHSFLAFKFIIHIHLVVDKPVMS